MPDLPTLPCDETPDLRTRHLWARADAREPWPIADASCALVLTSPPYPMIAMWDSIFSSMNPEIQQDLDRARGREAFEKMHLELDKVWAQAWRVLLPGGIAAINIGDATRSLGEEFRLWSNHARILRGMESLGFQTLPDILWRKPTNAPNKFMGSGMLPAGAYVTYEHEYILLLRKGSKRVFKSDAERALRARSAFFWEERNTWFSDLWTDIRGTSQELEPNRALRDRSAAFPFEIPFRLIQMLSVQGDLVVDPFAGTGTTLLAAAASGRQSLGLELDPELLGELGLRLRQAVFVGNRRVDDRLAAHKSFIEGRKQPAENRNRFYNVPVVTRQEADLMLARPRSLRALSERECELRYEFGGAPGEQVGLF